MLDGVGGGEGFLGVERSLGGRRWVARATDDRLGLALSQRFDLPELVGRLLAARGVGLDDAEAYLTPTLRTQLPDPSSLRDMDRAAARLAAAIRGGEPIAIFGDYDVDGATASAVLGRFLAAAGARWRIYIPDRLTEGYGPNTPALLKLKAEGVRVVVTVDCGATAHAPLADAAAAGLDVIVCDHHIGEPALPAAFAVVNPNRFDETTPHRVLAAVGVAFLLAVAVNRLLRGDGWYGPERPEPDLLRLLDLVALGTVADVVPLTGINRALVIQGLRVLAQRGNVGLAALADVAGLGERADAYHLGYIFGPRVNAGGRVGNAALGARLLTTDDAIEARTLALELHALNDERRAIEATVLEGCDRDRRGERRRRRAGVRGRRELASGRDRHRRGAAQGALQPARHRGRADRRRRQGLGALGAGLRHGRGRDRRAPGRVAAQWRRPCDGRRLHRRARAAAGARGLPARPCSRGDRRRRAGAAPVARRRARCRCGDPGAGRADRPARPVRQRQRRAALRAAGGARGARRSVGENHVRCVLSGALGGRLKAIAFRAAGTELGRALLRRDGGGLHIAGQLRADTWQGRDGCQLIIDDAAEVT